MNQKALQQLEFNKIKERLSEFTISDEGKSMVDRLEPSNDIKRIEQALLETSEARAIINKTSAVPIQNLVGMGPIMDKVKKMINLTPEELTRIADGLRNINRLKQFMSTHESIAPHISGYAYSMHECKDLVEEVDTCIKNGRVVDEASGNLEKIRKRIYIAEDRIKAKLDSIVKSAGNQKYLQDQFISTRDGHHVIAVKNEYRHAIPGALIGKSSTGSTCFIEPASVIKLQAELTGLKMDEENEIYQIMSYLSALVQGYYQEILINVETLSTYDFIFAKGKMSKQMNGHTAGLNYKGYTKIINGKHPLIGNYCVPLNFEIGNGYKALVITGPNTGGKTVALKTVGLLTSMIQAGLHVPADEGSEFAIYSEILVDIGDGQSIAQSLSTFSSHITNIIDIMGQASKYSMVILDEIGSGTDPMEGEGLAIAILKTLYKKRATIIASSHYSKVKYFAHEAEGFTNGKMIFDVNTLKPTYKLEIGKAGESNAFIIALKLGLSEDVIKLAHEASYGEDGQNSTYGLSDDTPDISAILKNHGKPKAKIPMTSSKAKRPKAMDQHKIERPVEITEDSFELGDMVFIQSMDKRGIISQGEDRQGEYLVRVDNKELSIHKKRLSLFIDREHLYPDDYDFDIVFKSKSYRKKNKIMNKRYDPTIKIVDGE